MLSAVRAMMQVVVAMKTVVSKEKEGSSSSSGSQADDKEQLSPVGVMDFPFDNDDDEEELRDAAAVACSPSFSLARLHSKSSSSYMVNKKMVAGRRKSGSGLK